jgi:PAS domain S-box-containing protein
MEARLPENEIERLAELRRYDILDTKPEAEFDELTQLAARICAAPVVLISLIDDERQWFKSSFGFDAQETSRRSSFCAHTILQSEPMIVPDTLQDARFADNEFVTNAPHFRFYAGVSLTTDNGHRIGTLCVLDREPRDISEDEVAALQTIARQVVARFEARRHAAQLTRDNNDLRADFAERDAAATRLRLLQSVVINANDAVLITEAEPIDTEGPRIIYVNEAFTRMTGYTAEEVSGATPRILHGAKTDRAQLDKVRHALEHWQPVRAELINYRKDGTEFWVELNISPVADESGWFTHWVSVQRDVTERKRIEEALRASEERYRQIVEQATEIIYKTDAKGFFTFLNPTFSRLLQYSETHLSSLLYTDVIRSDVRAEAESFYTRQLAENTTNTYYEVPVIAQDGTEIWIGQNVQLVYEDGQVVGFQAVARDITARKQAEDIQQKTSREIVTILSSITDAFLTLDRNWRFTYLNRKRSAPLAKRKLNSRGAASVR